MTAAPLEGRTIAITRSEGDSAEFIRMMRGDRANPLPLPTIELAARGSGIADELLDSLRGYRPDYSVFMSSKAVRLLFDASRGGRKLDELRLAVSGTAVVAVGPKTRDALEGAGIRVAHVPEGTYSSVGVGELFTRLNAAGRRVIVPRSGASTPFLRQLLGKIGLEVRELHLYDVRASPDTAQWDVFRRSLSRGEVDGIVFTSASSVRAFFEIMGRRQARGGLLEALGGIKVVSIGPFTADELRRFDVQNTVSEVHTVPGAVDAIRREFSAA